MARPTAITVAAGSNYVIPINWRADNFGVGFSCVPTGGANYYLEHTFDDIYDSTVTPTWHTHSTDLGSSGTPATATQDGNYAYPIRAVRLTVTTAGSVTMNLIQNN